MLKPSRVQTQRSLAVTYATEKLSNIEPRQTLACDTTPAVLTGRGLMERVGLTTPAAPERSRWPPLT